MQEYKDLLGLPQDPVEFAWSGYHAADSSWSLTSATFASFAGDATSTFTERVNRNFGAVKSAADGTGNIPGIVINPPLLGIYQVSATAVVDRGTDGANTGFLLVDNYGNTVAEGQNVVSGGYKQTITLSGILNVVSLAQLTLQIKGRASAGTCLLGGGSGTAAIEWTIYKIRCS